MNVWNRVEHKSEYRKNQHKVRRRKGIFIQRNLCISHAEYQKTWTRKHYREHTVWGGGMRRSRRVCWNLLNINNNLFWKLCRNTKILFLLVSLASSTWSRWNQIMSNERKREREEKNKFLFFCQDPNPIGKEYKN